ncbi:hypothetical protein [Kitasatospora sp. NBC_01266]|uniref:hypothetical protein n=1 Tax=Kitasatospora sp. NBC_01266 TaxID=2903572 RepID=UPI002E2F3A8E|nr:hypothetical protein [Kitasatospora sp. NBC_01266]
MAEQPHRVPAAKPTRKPSRTHSHPHSHPPGAAPDDRRAKAAAAREAERRVEHRRRLLVRSAAGLLGLAVLGGLTAVAVTASGGGSSAATASSATPAIPTDPRSTADGRTSAPPWPAPADPAAAVTAAGLPMLGTEGTAEHIHTHLDVYLDGRPVTVPALVGIDEAAQQISPLHTHDTSGVIHIESPVRARFTLGQFMTEWQVSVAADHLGGARADATHTLTAYVNGKPVTGDPAAITLGAHDEIALVYGTAAEDAGLTVPSGYAWPSGL